jgi:N-acetylglucosaminyl-diphospho-decaprenol L-rhamnosyltransferase
MSVGVPQVAVVVATYNSAPVLGGFLESLREVDVDLVSVVVADNASADDSVALALAAAHLPLRVVQTGRNAGYAGALNAGTAVLDLRKLDAVFLANPDCRVRKDTLGRLAAALAEPGRAIAMPRLVNPDGSLQPTLRRTPALHRAMAEAVLGGRLAGRLGSLGEMVTDPRLHEVAGPVAWATGAALLISGRGTSPSCCTARRPSSCCVPGTGAGRCGTSRRPWSSTSVASGG